MFESGQLPAIGPVKASQLATVVAQAFRTVEDDEVTERVGVVDVNDVAMETELDDSNSVGTAEDRERGSITVELELDVTSELWEEATFDDAPDELEERTALDDKIGAPWSHTLTYVVTKLVEVRKLLAVAL